SSDVCSSDLGRVAGQACIADHPIVGAVGLDVGFQLFTAGGAIGNVELQDARLAAQPLNLCLDGFGFVAAGATVQDDIVARAGQTQRDGTADASAGAGDEDGFTHGVLPGSAPLRAGETR